MYQNGKNITIIDHNVNCVDSILNDIRDTHPLSTEDEHQLWLSMQQGSKHARSRLIESNMRYVVSIAKRYILSGAALEDLILAGCEGLTRAADKFDGSLGYRFISFATWYIENEIRKTAYDYIKHNHTSLDGPVDADDERGATHIEFLADERSNHPDWNIPAFHAVPGKSLCLLSVHYQKAPQPMYRTATANHYFLHHIPSSSCPPHCKSYGSSLL